MSVMLYTALIMPALIGSTALGVEVVNWSGATLDCQIAADQSARAGAIFLANNPTLAHRHRLATAQACNLASVNGFSICSAHWQSSEIVSVTVNQSVPLFFSAAIINRTTLTVSATAVASLNTSTTPQTVTLIQ